MSEEKIFLSIEKQVNKLEKRKLHIGNAEERKQAKSTLKNISYYALVNGYKDIFLKPQVNPGDEDDYNKEKFTDLRDIYGFDKELGGILFKYLIQIEDSLKAVLSYYIGKKYGHLEADYLLESNYRLGKLIDTKEDGRKIYERDILIRKLKKKCLCKEDQIIHNRNRHGNVPPWVLASVMDLDTLLYWYKLSQTSIKKEVVRTFLYDCEPPFEELHNSYLITNESMELFFNCMMIIKEYRNRAAHSNRIVNNSSRFQMKIDFILLYSNNNRELLFNFEQANKKNNIFMLYVAICVMFSKKNIVRNEFIEAIENHFYDLEISNPHLNNLLMRKINLHSKFAKALREII